MRTFGHDKFGNDEQRQPEKVEIIRSNYGCQRIFLSAITTAYPVQ